jgi:maltose alpha-D-glucosyltransferase/alpha-amylase
MSGDGGDPLWYKDAVIYEVHVRAFADSNGDGRGDFQGLTGKLDYLRDLGVTAIWVLPFYPSPWRDDGYDISDYTGVHPAYGTAEDFKIFLDEAHRRGLKVITELVINHTSDQHPWFQRARLAPPGSPERDFYVWSETDTKYAGTRIIFTDTEVSNWTRDPVANAYYWHRFFSHQPDLNFDNPRVHEEVFKALDFWMEMGVDGLRLDAVPYLYEREGTNNENLPETHAFLKKLRAHVDAKFPGRMLLAEANQWPEDSIAYFGDPATGGDECHMSFHFPVMPRLFMAVRMEDRFPIIDILQQTPPIPETAQWATFLRNHDELTLEMVTDEERDYMYRVYAADKEQRINVGIRRRLASLLGNDRRRIELMSSLLLSLPGTPVLYYGDEIGMGDNFYLGDRNGVRTPMQWSADKNAGFSRANPQRLFLPVIVDPGYHYETVNVEAQDANPHSLLWWMRRVIALRKRHRAFSRGTIEFLAPDNHRVLAFLRRFEGETLLVVVNLSRFVQHAELDLSAAAGLIPLELFGRSQFPRITEKCYPLTLGPHSFYWFALMAEPAPRRWAGGQSGGKSRTVSGVAAIESILLPAGSGLSLVRVGYVDGEAETYVVPAEADLTEGVFSDNFYAPLGEPAFARALLDAVVPAPGFPEMSGHAAAASNTLIRFGDRLVLKVFHKLEPGIHPELEIGRFLSEKTTFRHSPRLAGWLEIRPRTLAGETATLGVLQEFVANEGDGWSYTLDALGRYFERALTGWGRGEHGPAPLPAEPLAALAGREPAPDDYERLGTYLPMVRLLAERTAELHIALASGTEDRDFAPEPFTELYQRSLFDAMRTQAKRSLRLLAARLDSLPPAERAAAAQVLAHEEDIVERFRRLVGARLSAARIRTHGDYHLRQVLFTGKDFVLLDFEGDPSRSLSERRLKRSPFRDVAGMLRSFHYAASVKLSEEAAAGAATAEALTELESWARYWERWVSAAFLRAWLERARGASFLPASRAETATLLDVYMLDKTLLELAAELKERPERVRIPLQGILQILAV